MRKHSRSRLGSIVKRARAAFVVGFLTNMKRTVHLFKAGVDVIKLFFAGGESGNSRFPLKP